MALTPRHVALPLLATATLVAPSLTSPAPASAATTSTLVATLQPWTSSGAMKVAASYRTAPSGSSCIPSNVTGRRDAYRCFIGSTVLDPVIKSPTANRFAFYDSNRKWSVYRVADVWRDGYGRSVIHRLKLANGATCVAVSGMGPMPVAGYQEWRGWCFGGPYTTTRTWWAKDRSYAHTNWPLVQSKVNSSQWLAAVELNGRVSLQLVAIAHR